MAVLNSITSNPPNSNLHITSHATDYLWAVFAIMLLSDLLAIFWSSRRIAGERTLHRIPVVILTVSTIAYFAMASDLGSTPVVTQFNHFNLVGATRQVWFVRYIQWSINAPLLIVEVLLVSGFFMSDIFTTAFMSLVFVVCGLVGALVHSQYKWGFFVLGVAAYFYVASTLVFHSRRTPFGAGNIRGSFLGGAGFLAFIWALYPICWGLSEGGNVITPTGEMIFYSVLDLLSGPFFLLFFMWSIRAADYSAFGFGRGHNAGGLGAGRGTIGGSNELNKGGPAPVNANV